MPTLGVVVFSLGEMKHLAQCLESVQWANAVVLLHIGDGEPAIGATQASSLTLRKIPSSGEAIRLSQEMSTDWVLHLWGEERVEADLGEELRALCRGELQRAALRYRIPIRSHLLSRWVEGSLWEAGAAPRLGRGLEELAPCWWRAPERKIQEAPVLQRGWIGDYTLAGLSHGMDRINDLSSLWAQQLQAGDQVAMALPALRAFTRLLWMNGVFSHGLAGLTLSTLAAYATLLSRAKAWEARNAASTEKAER